jgi:hypothetical protein
MNIDMYDLREPPDCTHLCTAQVAWRLTGVEKLGLNWGRGMTVHITLGKEERGGCKGSWLGWGCGGFDQGGKGNILTKKASCRKRRGGVERG